MNYIIFDLEWNQSTLGKAFEKENFPFEIIEIGAVKLDDNREFVDTFQCVIKPQVYRDLFPITREIVHIKQKELKKGTPFAEVVKSFFEWCGEEFRFCTWGAMDLFELQRNMRYYGIKEMITKPFFFYDVQKLFSLQTEGKKNPKTLEYAVEYFQLEKEGSFHRALNDAEYTAKVLQKLDWATAKNFYSIDCFCNPKTKEEEIEVIYKNYSKYITREFSNREELFRDRDIRKLVCFHCKKTATKKIDWFSNNPKNYYALAYCREHGYLKGRIQINKSTDTKKTYAVKIVSGISKEAAQDVVLHRKEIEVRRRERKINKKKGNS